MLSLCQYLRKVTLSRVIIGGEQPIGYGRDWAKLFKVG